MQDFRFSLHCNWGLVDLLGMPKRRQTTINQRNIKNTGTKTSIDLLFLVPYGILLQNSSSFSCCRRAAKFYLRLKSRYGSLRWYRGAAWWIHRLARLGITWDYKGTLKTRGYRLLVHFRHEPTRKRLHSFRRWTQKPELCGM